jgi:hypothetical protein
MLESTGGAERSGKLARLLLMSVFLDSVILSCVLDVFVRLCFDLFFPKSVILSCIAAIRVELVLGSAVTTGNGKLCVSILRFLCVYIFKLDFVQIVSLTSLPDECI